MKPPLPQKLSQAPSKVEQSDSDLRGELYDYAEPPARRLQSFESTDNIQDSRFTNDFEVLETLGSGNFGKVLKCRNKLDGSMYAVKVAEERFKSNLG